MNFVNKKIYSLGTDQSPVD